MIGEQKEKFYVTTPIYYVNDVPHLGHAYTSVFADIIARYHRSISKEVFFLTGTDENGAKVNKAAEIKGVDVAKFVDENSLRFREILKVLNISNDDFVRTTDQKKHWPAVKEMWKKIKKNGDIYKDRYKGLYCVECEAFVTEKDLKGGKCVYHDKKPEEISEENYFFKLSKYSEKIKNAISSEVMKIYPESRKNEALAFIKEGLKDISFSRPAKDLKWGIPVPGDKEQTIYVWCDALTNYLSALGFGQEEKNLEKFWPADMHIMAKDILRFHAIIWPAMLLSAGLPLPKNILVHGFINVGGKKMSKTLGNVINPFLIAEKYGTDVLRYYLASEISPFEDGDFTEEKLLKTYNGDLANGLGNFVSRVFKMAESYFGSQIKKPSEASLSDVPLKKDGKETFSIPYIFEHTIWPEYRKTIEKGEINKAINIVREALSSLDGYIQDYEPFKLVSIDKEKTEAVLWSLLYGLNEITKMLEPFMPETAKKIFSALWFKDGMFALKFIATLFPRKEENAKTD